MRTTEIRFGDFDGVCELCFKGNKRFGTLTDPVGRLWLLCVDCIKSLWEDKQAINQEQTGEERRKQVVEDFLNEVRDRVLKGEL
jgi:hypothetical protein